MVTFNEQSDVRLYSRQNSSNTEREMVMANPPAPRVRRQTSLQYFRQISRNTSTVMKCIVILSLLFNLLTIPSLGIVITLMVQRHCFDGPQDRLCFPCGAEGIPGLMDADMNGGFCCAPTSSAHLQRLLKYKMIPSPSAAVVKTTYSCKSERRHGSKEGDSEYNGLTVAHLLIDAGRTKQEKRICWSSTKQSFIQGSLKAGNSSITVKADGIYRVQNHISFDSVSNTGEIMPRILDHSVDSVSSGKSTRQGRMKITLEHQTYKASDIDIIVKLKKGDQIKIVLSEHSFKYLFKLDISNSLDIEKIG